MELILTILLIAVLIIQLLILLKSFSKKDTSFENRISILENSIKTQLDSLPEITKLKVSENILEKLKQLTADLYKNNQFLIEKFGHLQTGLSENLAKNSKVVSDEVTLFRQALKKNLDEDFDKLISKVELKFDHINNKVEENLKEGFKKTNETFTDIIKRLAKIDEAQKNIENLSSNVVSLQDILTDKKSRGIFGEVQLNQVLYSVFGEKNDKIFQIQHKLSNGKIADAILFTPEPTGNIVIDSKFPLDNYKKMMDKNLSENERAIAHKLFQTDIKKHIDDIAGKYIIPKETSNQAIMFVPAEAIFAELYAYHSTLIEYANRKKVWITSPTTFMAVLSTLQVVINNLERRKFAHIIQQEIMKLAKDFERYQVRWENLSKHIDTVQKDVKEIYVSANKISTSFEKIANVELSEEDKNYLQD